MIKSLKKIYDLIKKDKNLELQFKFNNKFVSANDVNVKEFMISLTHNKTKKRGGKKNTTKKNYNILIKFKKILYYG
tara:strand:- start:11458 stop:11685 length:228 start_codon:yes stop_codon:yes gene_type:complete